MGESRIAIIYALAANVVLAVAKTAAGVATGSAALLAEAAHSTADTVDQVALLWSLHMGRRPADEEHPFGHGKERFFWAFVVRRGARRSRDSLGRYVRELRDPAPRIVLLEDGAAVIGVVVAGCGLIARHYTGDERYDAAASIAIGVLLAGVAVAVGTHAKDLLLGQSARAEVRRRSRRPSSRSPTRSGSPTRLRPICGRSSPAFSTSSCSRRRAGRMCDRERSRMRRDPPTEPHRTGFCTKRRG